MGRGRISAALLAIVSLIAAALPLSLVVASATPAGAAFGNPVKILPLGDSITKGIGHPSVGGYRDRLENELVNHGKTFKFLGQYQDGPASLADKHHEGIGGKRIGEMTAMFDLVKSQSPDIVLLIAGTNDMGDDQWTTAHTRLANLINNILGYSSVDYVVVGTIPPRRDPLPGDTSGCPPEAWMNPRHVSYNNQIKAMASARVKVVDMYPLINPSTEMADCRHPNKAGYEDMGTAWYNSALAGLLTSNPTVTVPTAPRNVIAVAGNGQATVTFDPPSSNGGAAVTEYTVTSTPGNITKVGSGSPLTVTGLTNGVNYTFTVKAKNSAGYGPPSQASNLVTPRTVPGVPTGVAATAGNAKATVNWTAPANNGGSPITGYDVFTFQGTNQIKKTSVGVVTSTDIGSLTNGTAYKFKVTAKNAAGSSAKSVFSNVVTPSAGTTVPGAPTIGNATAGNGEATVRWSPPANPGSSAINAYIVYRGTTDTPLTYTNGSATQATVSGLTNGTAYQFTVKAQNSSGLGPASALSNSVTPTGVATEPGAPTNVQATPGDGQATVSFTAPPNNGAPITRYKIYDGSTLLTTNPATPTTSPLTVTGLSNGTTYNLVVTATNSEGEGQASSPQVPVTPQAPTAPGAPTIGTATAGNASATVRWTPPANTGGSAITGYKITSNPAGSLPNPQSAAANATSFNFTGLTNGTPYAFTVVATNSVGDSPASAESSQVTPTAPAAGTYLSDVFFPFTKGAGDTGGVSKYKDMAINNLPLKLGSTVYPKGVQTWPTVHLTFDLTGRGYSRFQSLVGVDSTSCGPGGAVRFKVFLDGNLTTAVFDSGTTPMSGATAAKPVDVDVAGHTSLTLELTTTNSNACNYGDWADAKFLS